MDKLNNFNDYLLELIIEGYKNDELMLKLSPRLYDLIQSIQHPIARLILTVNQDKYNYTSKITLLDIDDSNPNKLDNISFFTSSKLIDKLNFTKNDISGELDEHTFIVLNNRLITHGSPLYDDKTRSVTSLGRIVNKLFPGQFEASGDYGNDIESFVNMYKAKRDSIVFKLVKGDDIIYYYSGNQYASNGGTLDNSCMKYNRCKDYINFYAKNSDKVSLLILMDDTYPDKIKGRALVWKLDVPEGRIFMDRIYTTNDYDVISFKNYAAKNGWLYKVYQSYDDEIEDLYDTEKEEVVSDLTMIVNDMKDNDYYPFADTMCYYNNNTLSNDKHLFKNEIMCLRTTSGSYIELYFSEYYNDFIEPNGDDYAFCEFIDDYRSIENDDCYFSDFYCGYIAYDYAKEKMYDCGEYIDDEQDKYRKKEDCVKTLDGYADKNYAEENMTYSKFSKVWLISDYADYSDKYKSFLNSDDTIEVYLNAQHTETDVRLKYDNTYFYFDYDENHYDNKVKVEDLNKKYNLKG